MSTQMIGPDATSGFMDDTRRLDVIILYEDLVTGLRAKETIDRIARQLEMDAEFTINLWRFELLRSPGVRRRVVREARQASLILFSAHGREDLPAEVKQWIEEWREQQQSDYCAFVVLLDACEKQVDNPVLTYLERTATEAKLGLFHQFCGTPVTASETARARIKPLAFESSFALEEGLPPRISNAGWGINE